jgi:hypothetical protein
MRTLTVFFATAYLLLADGGSVLLYRESPPFIVTVFASPTPARAGVIDLSVLLQATDTLDPVLDADVRFLLSNGADRIQARASHREAQNKMLYAASVLLDHPGRWQYTVSIAPARGSLPPAIATGTIAVAEGEPKLEAYRIYVAFPFACLAVYAVHQRLRWAGRKASGV